MRQHATTPRLQLSSGKSYSLAPIRNDLIPYYYLLAFPAEQGQPSAAEVTEMLNAGILHAQTLGQKILGDRDADLAGQRITPLTARSGSRNIAICDWHLLERRELLYQLSAHLLERLRW